MTARNYSSVAQATTLTSPCTDSATAISVASTSGLPAAPYTLCLDMNTGGQELVLVTAVSGLNLTVTRGYDSTPASAHTAGASVTHTHAAIDFRDAAVHENSTAAHGVTGAVVGTTDTQVLTHKDVTSTTNTFPASLARESDLTAHTGASTGVHGVAGSVVGTTDAQTLTNKTLTSPVINGVLDANGNQVLSLGTTVSAVNDVQLRNSVAGQAPIIQPVGADTNVSLNLRGKGTGTVQANGVTVADVSSAQTLSNKELTSPVLDNPSITGVASISPTSFYNGFTNGGVRGIAMGAIAVVQLQLTGPSSSRTDPNLCVLPTGFIPVRLQTVQGMEGEFQIGTDGTVQLYGTTAANQGIASTLTYILA